MVSPPTCETPRDVDEAVPTSPMFGEVLCPFFCPVPRGPVLRSAGQPAGHKKSQRGTGVGFINGNALTTVGKKPPFSEIGKYLNLPTQAYISMSDAKRIDAQAGLESGTGATLAALAGINSISGPGMVDFESCQSLEKLVLDNEMCGMTFRLIDGITPRDDFPALPIFQELLREKHLLIAEHTTRYRHKEIFFPGPAIDRANRERWKQQGAMDLNARLHNEVNKLLKTYQPSRLPETTKQDLVKLMEEEARRHGQEHPPQR